MPAPQRFLALFDLHWGYTHRPGRHLGPLHDLKAIKVALAFAKDWKPDVVILGGACLDSGPVSHHLKGKQHSLEGLRLLRDAVELRQQVLDPLEALKPKRLIYLIGNHEQWVDDLLEDVPGLEGIVSVDSLLKLTDHRWQIVPQGGFLKLGKLYVIHGDGIKGNANVAKRALDIYDRNVRFGHFHTYQAFTKHSPLDVSQPKTAIAVPALCRRDPSYLKGAPNQWVQGFLYGSLMPDGTFFDTVAIIVRGRTVVGGVTYHA